MSRDSIFRFSRTGMAIVLLGVLTQAACTDRETPPTAKAQPGPVPMFKQRPGDPRAGYDALVNGGYITCGIPYNAWRRSRSAPVTAPTLPNRPGRNADIPYYLTVHENAQGVEIVTTNCLFCHGGLYNGRPVIGLGNESLDFTRDPRELVDAVGAYVRGERETAAWRKWAQRISAIAPYMITDTVGVNPAPNLTLALIAHRDPKTLAWSEDPSLPPPPQQPLPVSVPPWWNLSDKHGMFYNAMGQGDHVRYMMMKSLVCTDSVAEAEELEAMFVDIRAYIASLEPPPYPFEIDASLARQGQVVFESHCSRCHGTYDAEGYSTEGYRPEVRYPNLVVPLETVGTDPAYALQAYRDSDRFMDWFNRSWYGAKATARPSLGYIAPPLRGVWATAPYLHNGSVPTVEALLDSGKRPAFWMRSFDSTDYDSDALGWRYRALSGGKQEAGDGEEGKRIYDTTRPGYSNQGHTFGDALTNTERHSLIEYLKTL